MTWATTYRPGPESVLLAGPHLSLLVALPADDPRLVELWPQIRAGAGADAVIEILLGSGLASLSAFALTALQDGSLRAVVRNPATLHVDDTSGSHEVIGSAGTWTDTWLPAGTTQVTLAVPAGSASAFSFPLELGVVQASAVTIDLSGTEMVAQARVDDELADRPGASPLPSPPTLTTTIIDHLDPPTLTELPVSTPDQPVAPVNDYLRLLGSTADRESLLRELAEAEAEADAEPQPRSTVSGEGEGEGEQPASTDTAVWTGQSTTSPPDRVPPAKPTTVAASASGLIAAFPWDAGVAPTPSDVPAYPAPTPPTLGQAEPALPDVLDEEADKQTVNRADLLAALQAAGAQPPQIVGPAVLAVYCPDGHPTSTYSPVCRTCGRAVEDTEPVTIPRPKLGVLRMANGQEVPLDRDVILGRSPHSDELSAADSPHRVKLEDAAISRTHARIELDEWQVLVRDLGSSYGTSIIRPGGEVEELRVDMSYPLEPGTKIILADEVTLTFEVHP